MKKSQFEHAVRAAGAILDTQKLLVIGSQAIYGSIEQSFPEAERSIEVDIAGLEGNEEHMADLLDGSIGELSMFQSMYGYYVQGVTTATAVLPEGWRKRLVRYRSNNTNGVTAYCLELHDLWISKMIAGREKDKEFCTALLDRQLVDKTTLISRLHRVHKLDIELVTRIESFIAAH